MPDNAAEVERLRAALRAIATAPHNDTILPRLDNHFGDRRILNTCREVARSALVPDENAA